MPRSFRAAAIRYPADPRDNRRFDKPFNIAVIGFALVVVLRLVFRGKGMNTKAVQVGLLRIDERLASIGKPLKDIG